MCESSIRAPEARRAYLARVIGEPVAAVAQGSAEAEPAAGALRDDAAETRDARLAILAAAERIFAAAAMPRLPCDLLCVAEYRSGRLALPDWVRAQVPNLTLRSLQRWCAAQKAGATVRLAVDPGVPRRGSSVLDMGDQGQVRVYALTLIARQTHLSAVVPDFGWDTTVETEVQPYRPLTTAVQAARPGSGGDDIRTCAECHSILRATRLAVCGREPGQPQLWSRAAGLIPHASTPIHRPSRWAGIRFREAAETV
ncbi:hypothetical protein [Methylobacterium sp. J-077]|uniref:hypothetical protein n=1 Tax=Methylobacterium sp. J-077 TaxID=2836656 RepID=UPI001FBAE778|nr:hypothetical protein [Methylobacterium sp. J-077]MCJ2121765.1 hypothetical protein [Methylobacterium sp. J-077]